VGLQDLAGGDSAWSTTNGNAVGATLGSVGVGNAPDSVFNAFGQQQLISTWGGRGGFTHNWDPHWSTSIYGAYAQVNYGSAASAIVCASLAVSQPGITTCNPNYSIGQAGVVTRWTPVKNLTFSADFIWQHLAQKYAGVTTAAFAGGYGTGSYVFADQNTYQISFRAQRNF
jgi:hypothetical protein